MDVVIHMHLNSKNIALLFPSTIDWDNWKLYKSHEPFSEDIIDFLNALSISLFNDSQCRAYPDIVTFAFFCRKANLQKLKQQYARDTNAIRVSRGILFHIAPSNVPVNFGYSLVAGLLSGNYNVVRVSSKSFTQVDIIVAHLHQLTNIVKWKEMTNRIVLVQYEKSSDATDYFSSFCETVCGGINCDKKNQIIDNGAICACIGDSRVRG